mgnify:CR=1 FL=1
MSALIERDPEVGRAIQQEIERQRRNINLIASENFASRAVLEAQGSVLTNKYAEGYPGRRYYGGCDFVDVAESLAIDGDGRIIDIGQKVTDIDDIEAQYMGLMRFRGPGVVALHETKASLGNVRRPWMDRRPVEQAYMTDLLMELILTGQPVHAVSVAGGWLEIDTVDDYRLAKEMIKERTGGRFVGAEAFPVATGSRRKAAPES